MDFLKCVKLIFIFLLTGIWVYSSAAIKNGYEQELRLAQINLNHLNSLQNDTLDYHEQSKLNQYMRSVKKAKRELTEKFWKTQRLIETLKSIDLDLFNEMDTIQDKLGNKTDIYIRIVDDLEPNVFGVTNLQQHPDLPDSYTSKFGDHSVDIRITNSFLKKSLFALVHELGHARYQIRNLSSYMVFFKRKYQTSEFIGKKYGHKPGDLSHKSVVRTTKSFKKKFRAYKKHSPVKTQWLASL